MTPIRPVSDEHRHEPADYELEPNELAAVETIAHALATSKARWSGGDLATADDIQRYLEMASTRHHAANIATALTQAPRSCWQPIEQKPDRDMAVLYFFSNLEFRSMDGGPSTMGPIRDHAERCEIGFYFAEHSMWCEAGTGHDVFECWRDKSDFPTHWQPLPEPPVTDDVAAPRSCCADERERCAKIVEDHAQRGWTASEVFKAIATAIREPTDALPGVGQMTRYKSSNSMGDCQRVCNAMRGTLAAIIADPDCCAASKAIARDALTYHANSTSSDDTSGAGHTPRPIGYASAEHLSRRTEYERNGSVIYATPCGTSTLPLFAGPLPDLDRSMKVWAEAGADLLEGPSPVVEAARQTARIYLHAGTTAERAHLEQHHAKD